VKSLVKTLVIPLCLGAIVMLLLRTLLCCMLSCCVLACVPWPGTPRAKFAHPLKKLAFTGKFVICRYGAPLLRQPELDVCAENDQ